MYTMFRNITILILAVCAATGIAAQDSPSTPKERTDNIWTEQNKEINASIKKMEGKIDLAFVGDSITRRWTGGDKNNQAVWDKYWGSYRAVNMGIGGDQTQNVLFRLQNGQLDDYQARVFVVMIGTNNCWDKQTLPTDVAAGIKKILDLIQSKQPQAKILLLGILPAGAKPNPGREKRAAISALISKFAGGPVHYMDISAKFLEPDGSISKEVMPDQLHLAPKGYEIWSEAIKDKVKELMGEARSGKTP